jgi:hypothetical protein
MGMTVPGAQTPVHLLHITGPFQCPRVDKPHPATITSTRLASQGPAVDLPPPTTATTILVFFAGSAGKGFLLSGAVVNAPRLVTLDFRKTSSMHTYVRACACWLWGRDSPPPKPQRSGPLRNDGENLKGVWN